MTRSSPGMSWNSAPAFQAALRVPGDPLETAREELINDRLKLSAVLE